MNFVGRKKELEILTKNLKEDGYTGFLLYGRRYVGKSTLIENALKDFSCPIISFECTKSGDNYNMETFSKEINDVLGDAINFTTPRDICQFLFKYHKDEKIIIVIDEYPYWRNNSSFDLDSVFQECIDTYLKKTQIKLILCGSYIDVMKQLTKSDNPLGGRLKVQLLVKPLNYLEASSFYPEYSNKDKIILYSVFGGLPDVFTNINNNLSVEDNIISSIISSSGSLYNRKNIIESELNKYPLAGEIFSILSTSRKPKRLRDIYDSIKGNFSKEWIRQVLVALIDMEFIKEVHPIDDNEEKIKLYQLDDPFIIFYYRYIYKNKGKYIANPKYYYETEIKNDLLTSYVPHIFEDIAKQYLTIRAEQDYNKAFLDIGTYYYNTKEKSGQFDVVVKDQNGYIFYECKFHNITISDIKEEEKQIENLPSFSIKPYKLGFIGLSKDDSLNCAYEILTLDDLY